MEAADPVRGSARVSAPRAHAARRASIAAAGVASATVAHVVSTGGIDILPIAPALWAMIVGLAAFLGTRRGPFRARGMVVTAVLVILSQFVMHAGMAMAPWAFGLQVHHAGAFITPASAMTHVVASVALVALVVWLERALALLAAVVRALTGRASARRRPGMVTRLLSPVVPSWPTGGLRRAIPSRGPPVMA